MLVFATKKVINLQYISTVQNLVHIFIWFNAFFQLYFEVRCAFWFSRSLKPLLQASLFLFSVLVSVTRVQDHKHHPHDVIAGSILGIVIGLFVVSQDQYLRFKENEKTNLVLYCPDNPLFLFDWKQTLFFKLTPQMVFTDNRLCRFNLWLLCKCNGPENPTNSIDIIVYGTNFSPNLKWFKTYNWHVKSLWSVKKEGYLED